MFFVSIGSVKVKVQMCLVNVKFIFDNFIKQHKSLNSASVLKRMPPQGSEEPRD